MSWQEDVVAAILADDGLKSIIGDKIFADMATGNAAAPFIVYQQISDNSETSLDGVRDVIFPLVQFSCWATTKTGAKNIAKALGSAIEGKNITGSSNASLGFSNQQSERDQQTKLFAEIIDYRISCINI